MRRVRVAIRAGTSEYHALEAAHIGQPPKVERRGPRGVFRASHTYQPGIQADFAALCRHYAAVTAERGVLQAWAGLSAETR